MLVVVGVLVFASSTVFAKLTGDNVCREEQRYTVNVTEYFLRNSTVRNYEWCLNVPPRCSFYTTRLINDSRIVEKEVTDLIEKCCSGYIEEDGICAPACPNCHNGKCVQGSCLCSAGYKGNFCDKKCSKTEWGENCKFSCTCDNGFCESDTGECICFSGWTGSRCEMLCPLGFFGPNCHEQCTCNPDQSCDPRTGHCDDNSTVSTEESFLSSPASPPSTPSSTKDPFLNILRLKNNGKFLVDRNGIVSTTIDSTPSTSFPIEDQEIGEILNNNYMADSGRRFASTTSAPDRITNLSKTKEIDNGENYVHDQEVNKNDLVNSASAATAISVGIIIVAVVIVTTNHFRRSKEKEKNGEEKNKGVSTVAVYTHSIFHTPLPEPPTFENPIFINPAESSPVNEGQRFETHVVCSMNFPPSKDPREYLYDHPPSTGSYRAASIPEPSDGESLQLQMNSVPHFEPVYDEIPSGVVPTPVSQPPSYRSSLYMNTCGKTRF